jgi:succinate dehydrogenase / fumarate reductase membrane anchor subunit
MMNYRTPLANASGLGAAKTGSTHWWMQRISAIALIPLTFWIIAFIKQLRHADHYQISIWLTHPINRLAAISFIIIAFYHAALGLQVVIEDYLQDHAVKIMLIWGMKLIFFGLALIALLSILQITF